MLLLELKKCKLEMSWKNISLLNEIYHCPIGISEPKIFGGGGERIKEEMEMCDLKRHSKIVL